MVLENVQVLAAVLGIIATAVLGFYGLRATLRRDKVTKEAGIETLEATSVQTAFEGLNSLAANLIADNAAVRQKLSDVERKLESNEEACDRKIKELACRIEELTQST